MVVIVEKRTQQMGVRKNTFRVNFGLVLECLEKEEEALDLGTSAPLVGNQIEQVNEGSKGMLDGARATVGIIRVTEHTQLTIIHRSPLTMQIPANEAS